MNIMHASRLDAVVTSIQQESRHVISIELRPTADEILLPPFTAGAHIDLYLGNDAVRSYSLCNDPDEQHRYVVGVLNDRNSRGGSRWIHENLNVGHNIQLSPPRNHFLLDETAEQTVMVAGGIDITPFLSMATRLKRLGKNAYLLYCVRSRSDLAFQSRLEELMRPNFHVCLHIDEETGCTLDIQRQLGEFEASAHFYCCGPSGMLNAFIESCNALGYVNQHIERFTAEGPSTAPGNEFTVELARSGRIVNVSASESLLEALLRHDVPVEYSCQEGMCGACETAALAGEIDHRDTVLSETERSSNKVILTCVSRSKSDRLVLDL